jgi:hypothetical protein
MQPGEKREPRPGTRPLFSYGPPVGRKMLITAPRMRCNAGSPSLPTEESIKVLFAVNSLPGRAKLRVFNAPAEKSELSRGTARGSLYGWLVICRESNLPGQPRPNKLLAEL